MGGWHLGGSALEISHDNMDQLGDCFHFQEQAVMGGKGMERWDMI